ncbi:MAG: C40 family peptidase [Spirochaetes bacterium]|nr:C40 family peptidase [Spirochaetota bacterium]
MNSKGYVVILLLWVFLLISCMSSQWQYRNIPLKRKQIINTATQYIGTPYRHGGTTPTGFDCSGYVYFVYKKNGILIPRSTQQQYLKGHKIPYKMVQPGDLLFFKINMDDISHVGIYIGNDTFVHAPSSGKHIRYDSINNPYWKKRFYRAVSYLKAVPVHQSLIKQSDSYHEERFVW